MRDMHAFDHSSIKQLEDLVRWLDLINWTSEFDCV